MNQAIISVNGTIYIYVDHENVWTDNVLWKSTDLGDRKAFELSFLFVRRTIANATWTEIRTAYASGIGLREIAL